ncbi:hypothetical protein K4K58_001702 [Colletotrichum sp. SAR11_239]|nr:hypothetical protein K4K58_001702 [Colletotrichum sp. SAR11_239]
MEKELNQAISESKTKKGRKLKKLLMLKSRAMIARHRPMGPEPPSSKKQLGISSLSMGQKRNVAYRRVLKLTTKDMVEWSCEKVFDVNTYITLFQLNKAASTQI